MSTPQVVLPLAGEVIVNLFAGAGRRAYADAHPGGRCSPNINVAYHFIFDII